MMSEEFFVWDIPILLLVMIEILQYLKDPKNMGIMVYCLLWVVQDLYLQPYVLLLRFSGDLARKPRVEFRV